MLSPAMLTILGLLIENNVDWINIPHMDHYQPKVEEPSPKRDSITILLRDSSPFCFYLFFTINN